jgi:hypothetical protein
MLYFEYNHGKTLECKDPFGKVVKVNKKNFDFVSGTMVFLGKEGSPYEGLVVPIEGCKVKK